MRVGWFGGSFDPPHRGHVAVARAAADSFGLDLVLVGPTGRQPLKAELGASFEDRMAMVRLACGHGRLRASDVDGPREHGEANYTVDALDRLKADYAGAKVFGIVGMDAFRQMGEWREVERVRGMVEWIVVSRPGYGMEEADGVRLLETVWEDVSATELRERLRTGEDCSDWVGERVMRYIVEHGLYRGETVR